MNLDIGSVPPEANEWMVTRAIAAVLHSDEYCSRSQDEWPINFCVKLNSSPLGGVRNNGRGILTLPTAKIGDRFLKWLYRDHPVKVLDQALRFYKSVDRPPKGVALTLERTPYMSPDIEEEREQKLRGLEVPLRVDEVQFGVFYRHSYPPYPKRPSTRAFSIEWEHSYTQKSLGWLRFNYDHKVIRVELGDPMTEEIGKSIAISFSSIVKLAVGYDGKPSICFDTRTPPVLEEIDFNRTTTGDDSKDNWKFRRRIGALHPGHECVAPYAHQVRIVLYNDTTVDVIEQFVKMCNIADVKPPIPCQVDAHRRNFFERKTLNKFRMWIRQLDWHVAFQLEAFLHNALLTTDDLLSGVNHRASLYQRINQLCRDLPEVAGDVLRHFHEALHSRPPNEDPVQCFERTLERSLKIVKPKLSPGLFICHHVTFTPTRMILEGPYATQSNRVIRRYVGYEDNFIRVDFRDEDRLQYRWDREVDGASFLKQRVGNILKGGFELAGRNFEFLAYSSSALREHAVWFMHPFEHPIEGWVTSASIRETLGDFRGDKLITQPSKYAARLAQAFTATDPSVRIRRDQWEEIPDIGDEDNVFTDGVGTISRQLGDMIWEKLCASRQGHRKHAIQPSVYQVRFLGYKGVVGVDEQLEGIKMCLRPSMNKFKATQTVEAEIEIARAFDYPNTTYLNRPLIMVLEDRNVKKEDFLGLQEIAVADARMIDDSIEQFRKILNSHSLGSGYRLSFIMKRLNDLDLDLRSPIPAQEVDNPFFARLRRVAMNHVLREIKHSARIPVPKSYLLVGVADEGPAYQKSGYKDVYVLPQGKIYACIQNADDPEPTWLRGKCMISRSPVVHPGDVQHVFAIGKPPADQLCLFRHMKNVVVLPSIGTRPLANCLGGGDLDGDIYDIIQYPPLLAPVHVDPASYPKGDTWTLPNGQESTVGDICDFVIEYINSDVLGLLSVRHLIIADQSKLGTLDPHCLRLAELCSQAVDYPKNGNPVNIDNPPIPRTLIRPKPDWQAAEVVNPRGTDYYVSNRAIGELYRKITITDPEAIPEDTTPQAIPEDATHRAIPEDTTHPAPLADPISLALKPYILSQINPYTDPNGRNQHIWEVFQRYSDELNYVSTTHVLTNEPGVRLLEEEIVIGTILAKCSQRRWRKDRMYRMRLHTSTIVQEVQRELLEKTEDASLAELVLGLGQAWIAWDFSLRNAIRRGANSFGLIALGVIFDCLERLGALSELDEAKSDD